MAEISVVVPIYNGEFFLERCVGSIINQTFKDIEIVLIDDKSNDDSLRICYNLAQKDSRIIIVSASQNGGVAKARNLGLEIAQGKYIMFCDCDDWVEPSWCETMYNAIEKNPSAWIICGFTYIYKNYTRKNEWDKLFQKKQIEKPITEYGSFVGNDNGSFSVCNKIFDKKS